MSFFSFLGIDLTQDCLNEKAFEDDFWYLWGSTGSNGFLLDLVKRPLELELRLEIYDSSAEIPAQSIKQYLSLDSFKQDNGSIVMGPLTLTNQTCTGTVLDIPINIVFSQDGRTMDFIPTLVEDSFPFFPDVFSRYGSLLDGTSVNSTNFPANLPVVYTSYPVPILLDFWQWAMISAMKFDGTDLQIELVSTYLLDLWLATSYVYYQGTEYKLDLFEIETRMIDTGDIDGDVRRFSAEIETFFLHLQISCEAPTNEFALLETEGKTQIHTTVLGICIVNDLTNSVSFNGKGALLEVKKISSPKYFRKEN